MNITTLIAEIKEQLKKISPFPWYADEDHDIYSSELNPPEKQSNEGLHKIIISMYFGSPNTKFIASAPQNIATLIEALEEAVEVIEFYKGWLYAKEIFVGVGTAKL